MNLNQKTQNNQKENNKKQMKQNIKIFTVLLATLMSMPVLAASTMSIESCEQLINNCLTVKRASDLNLCNDVNDKLPGIANDNDITNYIKELEQIAKLSNKPDTEKNRLRSALKETYISQLSQKYCSNLSDVKKTSRPPKTNTATTTQIDPTQHPNYKKVEASLAAGVKVGSILDLGLGDFATNYDKWEQACLKSQKPEGAKKLKVNKEHRKNFSVARRCEIELCDKDYTLSKDNLECEKSNKATPDKDPKPDNNKNSSTEKKKVNLDEKLNKDLETLRETYIKTVKKIVAACEKKGKHINQTTRQCE